MTRTKLKDRTLPSYTKGEEVMNMVTHIVGAAFGVVQLTLCLVFSCIQHDGYKIVASVIYGSSIILLYTMSSIYHGLKPGMAKKVLQVIDHCTIYLLIAGTYTPIVLCPIRTASMSAGWILFGIVWGLSAVAAVFTAIDHNRFKVLSMIFYIGIGWIIVFALRLTIRAVTPVGFAYLLGGGIAYTVGAILYGLGKYRRYMHSVFHLFVLLGTGLQFVAVFEFCILQ